jgi:hypothetical protein
MEAPVMIETALIVSLARTAQQLMLTPAVFFTIAYKGVP